MQENVYHFLTSSGDGIIPGTMNVSSGLAVTMTSNATVSPAPQLTSSAVIRSSILGTMSVISVIGNSWTILNIHESRVAKKLSHQNCTAIYRLIAHLSMADLLVSFFCMAVDSVWLLTVQWIAGDFMWVGL